MKTNNNCQLLIGLPTSLRAAARQLIASGIGLAFLLNILATAAAQDQSVRMSDLIFDTDKDQVAEPLYRHSQDSYPSLSPMDNKKEIYLG